MTRGIPLVPYGSPYGTIHSISKEDFMKKRLLSLCLTAALCLTLLPTAAWATENTTEPSTQLIEPTPVPQEQATPPAPTETETPDQGEDKEPPAAEEVASDREVSDADSTHEHPICGKNCTHSPTDSDQTWTGISDLQNINQNGSYYLTKDVTLTSTWTCQNDVNLCLNGHSIEFTASAATNRPVISVTGGKTFTLTDCNGSKSSRKFKKDSAGRWVQANDGTIEVNGGAIFCQNDTQGGCVEIDNNGTFNMYGGTICGNGGSGYGGVYVSSGGTFNMYGGKIAGNTAKLNGGGVSVGGTFTMSGGTITDNTANSNTGGGGGVYVSGGTFTMSGSADISKNTAGNDGGGVYVQKGNGKVFPTFEMTGGTITDNTAGQNGGGVSVGGKFTMSGGSITENNAQSGSGGGVYVQNSRLRNTPSTFEMKGGNISKNTASQNGGGVCVDKQYSSFKVADNVTITENKKAGNVYLSDGKTITIDVNLSQTARIGVTTAEAPTSNGNISIATGATEKLSYYTNIFTPDEVDKGYVITKNGDKLSVHQHSWRCSASGTNDATITATCQASSCPHTDGGSVTIKAPEETTLTYTGREHPATLENHLTTGAQVPAITYTQTAPTWQALKTGTVPTNAGTYKASITVGGVTASVEYTIKKATLTATDFTFQAPTDLTYNGNPKPATVTSSKSGMGAVTVKYYQGGTPVEKPTDVGEYTVKIDVAEGNNYAATQLTADSWKFTIKKANYTGTKVTGGSAKFGAEGTVDLSSLIAEGGTAAFDSKTDNDSVLDGDPTVVDGKTLKFKFADGAKKDQTAKVTVNVTGATNYNDYTITVTLKVTEKMAQASLNYTGPSEVTYGKTVPLTFTGGSGDGAVTYRTSDTSGNIATVDNDGLLTAKSVGTVRIGIIKAGGEKYEDAEVFFDINVTKAPLTIKVSDQKIYVGDAVPDLTKPQKGIHYTVTGLVNEGDLKSAAVMKYRQNGKDVATPDTSKPGVYDITLTGLSTATQVGQNGTHDNYERKIEFGKLTILARPGGGSSSGGSSSSGGGGSAATPSVSDKAAKELKNAKEGSTVTIDMKGETKLPASVTKEIAGKDVTVELDMGGGMVWSFNGLDVPKGGVRLDLGVKTGTKTIPAKVINAQTGETTTIQLQLNHNGPFGISLKLSVDLGKKHNGSYANLYFYNSKSGELEFQSAGLISGGKASWVFDHASDYAIVIDKESHEPMTFIDVPNSTYYAEAVNWAVAKKITEGVGNKLFGSNDPCTRAQIVTFLWRAAGSPGPKTMSGFSDVPADSYYAKAVAWAVENGITGGTGDGKFSPDATCTRAQAVTFLYRASGAPAVSGNAAFSDVATNAYYAAAVKWAEKNGITGGIGGGLFGPNHACTRAQIVTFLYKTYQGA